MLFYKEEEWSFRSEGNSDNGYLFVNNHQHYKDKRISYSGIYGVFKRAAKKAGIEFKFHDTRHTYVTNLIETGMDISVVRILVGHAYVSTTQKYVSLSSQFVAKSLSEYWQKVAYKEGERN